MASRLALRLRLLPLVTAAAISLLACGGARASRTSSASRPSAPYGTDANPWRVKLAAGGSVDVGINRADSTFSLALRTRADSASRSQTRVRLTAEAARWWADSLSRFVNATEAQEPRLRLVDRSGDKALELERAPGAGANAPIRAQSTADGSALTLRPDEVRSIARHMRLTAYVFAPTAGERPEGPVYLEFEVEKPVVPDGRGGCQPRYPEQLRLRGTTGEVRTQFIVDTAGRIEPATFRVIEMTHMGFAEAVQAVVPCMRFLAAEVHGRKVRQVVQQPFAFDIAR